MAASALVVRVIAGASGTVLGGVCCRGCGTERDPGGVLDQRLVPSAPALVMRVSRKPRILRHQASTVSASWVPRRDRQRERSRGSGEADRRWWPRRGGEQHPTALLDRPGGADLAGRVA